MEYGAAVSGEDVQVEKLVPLHERKPIKRGYTKILSSIRAVGLIEPLCVYPDGEKFVILDGYLRYLACQELGIATVPCIILPTKEAYTCNRMVNHLSPVQESRMINESLGTVEEDTIANALGLVSIRHRMKQKLLSQLHPQVVEAYDKKSLPLRVCSDELTFVKPEYQVVILKEMQKTGDYSRAHARTLILRAPDDMRNNSKRSISPWIRGSEQKKELAVKLGEVEKRYDFYSGLYRQYVTDLLKLCIYVRQLVSNRRIAAYMKSRHPEMLERFHEIVFESEGKKTS
jgi:ParB family transcriptional regulator, chromosome partitioning protein